MGTMTPDMELCQDITWNSKTAAKAQDEIFTRVTKPAAVMLGACVDAQYRFGAPEVSILEIGAGTGALTKTLLDEFHEIKRYVATDKSHNMLELLKTNLGSDRKNLEVKEVDALILPDMERAVDAKGVTHVLSAFMNQYCPRPIWPVFNGIQLLRGSTLKQRRRVIGLGCWGRVNIEDLFNEAWTRIEPGNPGYEMFYPDWPRTANEVKRTLENMGIMRVYVQNHFFNFNFKTVEEFLKFFFESAHPAVEYLMREVRRQGREDEFRREMKRVLKEGKVVKLEDLSAEAIIAVGSVL